LYGKTGDEDDEEEDDDEEMKTGLFDNNDII
jgi:hypothetical protein